MKKFFLMLQLAALSAGSSAFALTGGPFENSDAGILLERGGFYQCSFRFRNGTGFALWTPDAPFYNPASTDFRRTTLITPSTNRTITDHSGNRSVFYYKGVTYVGAAFGEIDLDAREVTGFCNADSEADFRSTSSTAGVSISSGFAFPQNTSQSAISTVVINNRSYVLNCNYTAKVNQRAPILRFTGLGQLALLSPSGRDTIAGLAYSGYSGLIQAIVQSVSNLQVQAGASVGIGPAYTAAQTSIEAALNALGPWISGTGPQTSFEDSEVHKV